MGAEAAIALSLTSRVRHLLAVAIPIAQEFMKHDAVDAVDGSEVRPRGKVGDARAAAQEQGGLIGSFLLRMCGGRDIP